MHFEKKPYDMPKVTAKDTKILREDYEQQSW